MILAFILIASTIIFAYISYIQIKFLKNQMYQKAIILDEQDYQKAATIAIENEKFNIFSNTYQLIINLIWIFVGFNILKDIFIKNNSIFENTLFILAWLVITMILNLPLGFYQSLIKDKKQGFSNMSIKLFIIDSIKSIILAMIVGFVLLYALIFCYDKLGSYWYIGAFIVAFVFILITLIIYPTLIVPIFNKMQKLKDENLLNSISKLMQKCGFSTNGVFIIDASKRDKRLNAYFGGLFKNKRVVLYDTLLKAFNEKELLAVLAHELGHFVHKDMIKNLFNSALSIFILFFLIAHLPNFLYENSNLDGIKANAFIMLILLGNVFASLILSPILNYFSRKNEFNADKHGAKMSSKEDMKNALITLAKENKAFVKAHNIYSFFHHSHPSIELRLKALA